MLTILFEQFLGIDYWKVKVLVLNIVNKLTKNLNFRIRKEV